MADSIIVLNTAEIARALREADTTVLDGIQQAVERWQLKRIPELARYPGQPPSSRYRRSGTLGRAWTSAKPSWSASSSGFSSKLGNSTPYGPFVQGTPQARGMGAWRQAEEIAQDARGQLEGEVQAAISTAEQQLNGVTS